MNKENNKSAAGRRPSAVKARIHLQEEWSALKGTDSQSAQLKSSANVQRALKARNKTTCPTQTKHPTKMESTRNMQLTNDILRGVVALVDTGSETRALPLRAALTAMGASVLPAWSPLVTHLIWTQGGSRSTRARARALACRLVSPLWVEACAASAARLPERGFPARARPSDLPSPAALRRMLKRVEMENIDINSLLSDSDDAQLPRLRISTDSEHDTSNTTNDTANTTNDTSNTANDTSNTANDTSNTANDTANTTKVTTNTTRDTSNTTKDTSRETTAVVESRVNTAPRRALPKISESPSPVQPKRSRRQLFTNKEGAMDGNESDETTLPPNRPVVRKPTPPQSKRKQLTQSKQKQLTQSNQKQLTQSKQQQQQQLITQCSRKQLARAERTARKMLSGLTQVTVRSTQRNTTARPRIVLTGMTRVERQSSIEAIRTLGGKLQNAVDKTTTHVVMGSCGMDQNVSPMVNKPRTVAALSGAARGCLVLTAAWLQESVHLHRWAPHVAHQVQHLRKLAQKARVERSALCKERSEYAYDVFNGMRVRLAGCKLYAAQLLALCGAFVFCDTDMEGIQDGGSTQNGGHNQRIQKYSNQEYDIKIGNQVGDINPKWIYDSVAASRMRTARRYVIKENSFNCLLATQMAGMMC